MDSTIAIALSGFIGAIVAQLGNFALAWWKHRRSDERDAAAKMSDYVLGGMESSHKEREQLAAWLREVREAYDQSVKQNETLRVELDELQRELRRAESRIRSLERQLSVEQQRVKELRHTLIRDYARKPSTPAPPPEKEADSDQGTH